MDRPLVMISYQWDAQPRMLKLKEELIRAGYEVWMDVDKMAGNLDDRMSDAVEKSSAILICFSKKYQESKSCKKEAQYADFLKKYIIPLKYEEYQPTGWLGMLVNPMLYHDVQTDAVMMQNLPRIIDNIESSNGSSTSPVTCDVPIQQTRSPSVSGSINDCQKELQTFYEQEMGTVQLLPWGNDVIDMDAIFVNLELAVEEKYNRVRKELEYVEDILTLKGGNNQRVNRVLLEGFAGSGKTTAMAKIAYDWAKYIAKQGDECERESSFSQYKLLFILSLRELEISETLSDAIFDQILPQDTSISKHALECFIQSHSKEILILLDGLDEYPMERLQKKVTRDIESILANKKMRDSCVVVTTRPQKIEDLGEHQKQYTQVKLSGFSKDNIEVYIRKFFKENHSMAEDLIEVLQQSPSIQVLAQIPVMLLMLCLLWNDSKKLPDTHTKLYEQALHYLWKRYKHSAKVSEKDVHVEEILQTLGKIALEGLLSDVTLVFSEKDIPDQVLHEACKAGLLTKERLRSKLNVTNSITFLHKSVQEYCAAYYWVSLAEKDIDAFKTYLQQIDADAWVFAQVELLTFCCGMSKQAATLVLPHVIQILKARTAESLQVGGHGLVLTTQEDIWPVFRMLRESGLKYEAVHAWFEPLFQSKVVEIRQNPPSSLAYFHYLVKIIAKSKSKSVLSNVRELKLFCGSGSLGLIVGTLDVMTDIESLVLSWETEVVETRPSEIQVGELSARMKKLSKLQEITVLARYKLDISSIIRSLYQGSQGSVSIRKIEVGNVDFDAEAMGLLLKKQPILKSLYLTNVALTPDDACQMLSQIRSSLQVCSFVSSEMGKAICHLKPIMPSLEELIARDAGLEEHDVEVLADLLPLAGKLKHLDISWNNAGSGMVKLARKLHHCPLIYKLSLINCNISEIGALELIESFQFMPRLVTVMVSLRKAKLQQTQARSQCDGFRILEVFFRSIHFLPNLKIIDIQCLPLPENNEPSPFLAACMSAYGMDLTPIFQRRDKIGHNVFTFSYRPRMGDKLTKLRAAIHEFNENDPSFSGTPV